MLKRADNHTFALALYFAFYNLVRRHTTFRCIPAMAAGLSDMLWSMEDVVALINEQSALAKKRSAYKPRQVSMIASA